MKSPLAAAVLSAVLGELGCGPSALSPLIRAARNGDVEVIDALIRDGADPNLPGGINDWTPLMHAIHKDRPGAVRTLLRNGADPNVAGAQGFTALMLAAGYGLETTVRDLLDAGADPLTKSRNGTTALDLAVNGVPDVDRFTLRDCQTETVRLLIERAPSLSLRAAPLDQLLRKLKRGRGCRQWRSLVARIQ